MTKQVEMGADISSDGRYRYRLWRSWGPGTRCVWVMLNPSTADSNIDDPTIRKCVGFAQRWGHEGIEVVNLFAWRATKPSELYTVADPVGPRCDEALMAAVSSHEHVVLAWGNNGVLKGRGQEVFDLIRGECIPGALHKTGQDQPGHPLYLPYTTKPFSWEHRA